MSRPANWPAHLLCTPALPSIVVMSNTHSHAVFNGLQIHLERVKKLSIELKQIPKLLWTYFYTVVGCGADPTYHFLEAKWEFGHMV